MANVKWSAFPSGTTISGSDNVVGLQSGADVLWLFSDVATYITSALTATGSGSFVKATSPSLVTPVLGVATATSVNKMAITAPATSSTLAVADGKTATFSSTITITGTDGKALTVSNSGTFSGGDGWSLAIAANKTLTVSNILTLAGTDSTVMTFPSTSATMARTDAAQTFTGDQTFAGNAIYSVAASGPTLKRGANGRVGTFTLNGSTPVTVTNSSVAVTDAIIFSLNTIGGTVGVYPVIATITAGVGFTVAGTALDSSVYNYAIIKNAA